MSFDQGEHWKSTGDPDDFPSVGFTDIEFRTVAVGFATAFYRLPKEDWSHLGYILKTTNGGFSWDTVFRSTHSLRGITFTSDSIGHAIGDVSYGSPVISSSEFRTLDGGNTWSLRPGNGGFLSDIVMVTRDTGFVCGYESFIAMTINGGETWIPPSYKNEYLRGPNCYGIDFVDSKIGFIVGTNGMIKATLNAGKNWFLMQTQVPSDLNKIDMTGVRRGNRSISNLSPGGSGHWRIDEEGALFG